MIIRNLKNTDIAACLSIYNYYIENTTVTFEENTLSLDEFQNRILCIAERYPFLVAEEDKKIIGYAYLDTFNERAAYRYTADLSIYLDEDFLHKGAGSLLYAELERIALKFGIKNIISIVTAENENSIRFHEKSGFSYAGTLKNVGYKFNRWLSVKYYQKAIK